MEPSDSPAVTGVTRVKPLWRRFAEVAVPVAIFAVGAPLAVNSIASAVTPAVTAPTTTVEAAAAPEASTTTTLAPVSTANTPTEILAEQITNEVASTSVPVAVAQGDTATTVAGGHSHGVATPEQPLTRAERVQLGADLAQARSAAMRYPTVADALADGYTMVTRYLPLIGAHYIKFPIMDTKFDIDQPEMLLYDGTDPTSHIVGLSYYVFSDTVPSPFTGPNDVWHQHIGLCLANGVVVGGEKTTPEECAKRGGAKAAANNGYMVHAWVVPGWDSPQGMFSPEHIGLTKDLPSS